MTRIHVMHCDCAECRQRHPNDLGQRLPDPTLKGVIAGLITSLVLIKIIDLAIGGPGIAAAFGF